VIAKTDIVLNPIDRWKFQYLTRKYPDFALFIMEVISRRLRRMNRRMDDDV
jgi:CRP-like cAMP-binding protein